MLRPFLLLLVAVLLSLPVKSQVMLGAKGGANVSTLGSSSLYTPRLGYHAALYYSQHIEEQYGIQFELQYSLQGARDAASTNGRLSYHYLALPVVLKLYFKASTFAEIGPQAAYLLKASYRESGFEANRTDQVKRFDLLGVAGFGHETLKGTTMGLRFGVGFLNSSGASVGNSIVFRNLFFQAHFGIKLKDLE